MVDCVECGKPIRAKEEGKAGRKPSRYCSSACRLKFNSRRAKRGAILYDIAMKMRKERQQGGFGELCHQISIFLDADKKDGRKTYVDYGDKPIPWHFPKPDPMKGKQ